MGKKIETLCGKVRVFVACGPGCLGVAWPGTLYLQALWLGKARLTTLNALTSAAA